MQTVLLTGGTGFIGRTLSQMLVNEGFDVIILTRNPGQYKPVNGIRYAGWDISAKKIDEDAIRETDFIIHLAGAGVMDKRWTKAYKKEIVDSRVNSSKLLVDSLKNTKNRVQAIISSSAIGWYGADRPDGKPFSENDPASGDYLGDTCLKWENAVDEAKQTGIRVCKLRTGIVLANHGGALEEFKKPLRLGVAGILGNGKQMISWIHASDLCRMFIHALKNTTMQGAFNAVAPQPVSNRELVLTMARAFNGKMFIPLNVPSFVLKMMLGEKSIEILKSAHVSADKIQGTGFRFSFPTIGSAMKDLSGK